MSFSSDTSPSSSFQGVWVPLVTPFSGRDCARVDEAALRELARYYRRAGVSGLVACGSTGEAAALTADEQRQVLDIVLDAAGDLPVMMGVSAHSQAQAMAGVKALQGLPLAGVLVAALPYVRPGQAGAMAYFQALADVASCPLVLYDIPYRTGTTLHIETLLRLAEHPNIAAIKDCGGDLGKTQQLIADAGLAVMAGEDLQAYATVAMGGTGMIAAAAHVRPELYVAMHQALVCGDLPRARGLFHALAPIIRLLFAEPNPGPLKASLAAQGLLPDTGLRQPMQPSSEALRARLQSALDALNRAYPPD